MVQISRQIEPAADPSLTHSAARAIAFAGVAEQASSDDDMVALWLGNYRNSAHTRRAYAEDMRLFRAFLARKPLRRVTVRDVQEFADDLERRAEQKKLSSATAARRLAAVKSLIGFAHQVGYITFDVGAPVQVPRIKDMLAERILCESDLQRMLGMTQHPRNAAILRLTYGAGLRVSELCGLRWRDCMPRDDGGQITVFGKGGKTRHVLLPRALWERVVALRGDAGDDAPVFLSRKGGALEPRQVLRIVKAAAKRAGLSSRVSTHWLRHAHVSHALDRGAPVHVVRATVGHASLETTTRYSHARPGDSSARYLNA